MSFMLVSLSNFIIVNSAFGTASVLAHEGDHDETANSGIYDDIIEGSNSFGYDLANYLYKDSYTNIWISPFSICSLLSVLYPGTNGATKSQIANISDYPPYTHSIDITQLYYDVQISMNQMYDGHRKNLYDAKPSKVRIINKLFVSDAISLNPSYETSIAENDISVIEDNFDFTANNASSYINDWVNYESNGLIEELIPENKVISDYDLAAFSTLYVNGTFFYKFNSSMTSLQKFYKNGLRKQETTDIHLMHEIGYFSYYGGQYYQFLRVPFTDSSLFILFALPIHHSLYDEEDQNGLIHHGALVKHALNKLERTKVAVAIPKISIDVTYHLDRDLPDLGMIDAFDPNLADFSGMSQDPLYLDTFIHRAVIEMNEDGLFAASVIENKYNVGSAMNVAGDDLPQERPVLFKADHPFQMFVIDGDHDNAILFMGEVNLPEVPEGAHTPTFDEGINSIWTNFTVYVENSDNEGASNTIHSINIITLLFICTLTLIL